MPGFLLIIPKWHPTPLNRLLGCHWGSRSKRKAADREMIAIYARLAGIPLATGKRRVALLITLRPRQRAGDVDAYWKSTLDALVATGLLLDDNRQSVDLVPVEFRRGVAAAWGTQIVLEDVENLADTRRKAGTGSAVAAGKRLRRGARG